MSSGTILDFEKPILELESKIEEMRKYTGSVDISADIVNLENTVEKLKENIYHNLSRWQRTQIARHPERPPANSIISLMAHDFIELHGDRALGEDESVMGGFALLDTVKVMIIAHRKMTAGEVTPAGFGKALRLMKLAEKFNRPVITLIDDLGGGLQKDSQQGGTALSIAKNLSLMSRLKVPIMSVITGEAFGASSMAMNAGDRMLMMENSIASAASPETAALMLWKNAEMSSQAAEALRLTAYDMLKLKLIDKIIPEPLGGMHKNPAAAADILKKMLLNEIKELSKLKTEKLLLLRFEKYARVGIWNE